MRPRCGLAHAIGVAASRRPTDRVPSPRVGTGTAAVISPIGELAYKDQHMVINDGRIGPLTQKLYDAIVGIQYGTAPDPDGWTVEIPSSS